MRKKQPTKAAKPPTKAAAKPPTKAAAKPPTKAAAKPPTQPPQAANTGAAIPVPAAGFTPASTRATTGVRGQVAAFVAAAWAQFTGGAPVGTNCPHTGLAVCAHNRQLTNSLRQAWYPHLAAHGIARTTASQYSGYAANVGAMGAIAAQQPPCGNPACPRPACRPPKLPQ